MSKMDLEFLRMLQSIALVEKEDPNFRTKTYDASTLKLKYPKNVIVVASPTSVAPPPSPGEVRMTKISSAIQFAVGTSKRGGALRFSILVHPGLYVDALGCVAYISYFPVAGFSLEIVGLSDVRIVCDGESLLVQVINLTLKNLLIYDRRRSPIHDPTVHLHNRAKVDLIEVKINAPKIYAVEAVDAGTVLNLVDCTLGKCATGFATTDGSEIHMFGCSVNDMSDSAGLCARGSLFTAQDTRFVRATSACFSNDSKGIFERCHFKGDSFREEVPSPARAHQSTALKVYHRSSVSLIGTALANLVIAVAVQDSNSTATLTNCRITKCHAAISVTLNGNASVTDSVIHAGITVDLLHSVNGTVELKRNDVGLYNGEAAAPLIAKDAMSSLPKHDFKNPGIIGNEEAFPSFRPSSKEQSKYTKQFRERMNEMLKTQSFESPPILPIFQEFLFKSCAFCLLPENWPSSSTINSDVKETKFKFCQNCKTTCYCSKKCQKRHWSDHKLICHKLAEK